MAYTVKQLSAISGVSIRTLHYYDEIGLLKPAYVGDNKYRYYEEAEVLRLQQILFYRELDFSLDDIQQILSGDDFDRLKALESHRKILLETCDRYQQLLVTVDKTIAHLRGDQTVKPEDIFEGFDAEKQEHYINHLVEQGADKEMIESSIEKTYKWKKSEWLAHKDAMDKLHDAFIARIESGDTPESDPVQALVQQHYDLTAKIWVPDQQSYIGLADTYESHPDFVKFYDGLHPKLLGFLQAAMRHYAKTRLS